MYAYRVMSLSCLLLCSNLFGADVFASVAAIFLGQPLDAADMAYLACPVTKAIVLGDTKQLAELAKTHELTGRHLNLAVCESVKKHDKGHIVRQLIQANAPIDFKAKDGTTTLMKAAESDRVDLVQLLHRAGANPHVIDQSGNTVVHIAAMFNASNAARYLLEEAKVGSNTCNSDDLTPLHYAVLSNAAETVEVLARHADCSIPLPVSGRTSLLFALHKGHEVVALPLIKGPGIDAIDDAGQTAMHLAAGKGLLDALRALLPLAACDVQDCHLRTPLFNALLEGQTEAAELLIDAGVQLGFKNHRGNTELHVAAAKGMLSIVEKLLAKGANPRMQNDSKKYPYELATNPEIIELLKIDAVSASTSQLPSASGGSSSDDLGLFFSLSEEE